MYARMTVARPQPNRLDEAVAMIKNVFFAEAQQQQGYRGFLLFVDPDSQQLTGISLWDSEADRQASAGGSGYYGTGIAEFAQLVVTPPVTTNVDVAVSEFGS